MEPKKTALYHEHQKLGAKIVEFAGYYMPIQYRGIREEHRRVRTTVGIFDVSHMGEFYVSGPRALEFLNQVTINDVSKLAVNQVQYSAMCYDTAGIVDDLLVYRLPDRYLLVVNAANLQKDWDWLQKHLIPGVKMENASDACALIAVQGRFAEKILQKLTAVSLANIQYYWLEQGQLAGTDMIISRTGYTGETGFELCFDTAHAVQVWNAIMTAGKEFDIEAIGLAARDSLRLEMKFCLYGNDIDATTHPLEAGLGWITKLKKGDFIGREALIRFKEAGIERQLIGFEVTGKAFPRHSYKIVKNGREIGVVTSGTVSPMLDKGIGMGYVPVELSEIGSQFEILIRDHAVPAQVVETPFYKRPY